MMRKCGGVLTLVAVALGSAWGAEVERLGEPLTGADQVPISAIIESPDEYANRLVRVEGRIEAVCKTMGCWMELVDADGASIQIKVDDGVIVFPLSAVGKGAIAEGRVEVRDLSRDEYVGMLKHRAEEQGEAFDEEQLGEPPFRMVRIRGIGAEVLSIAQ